MNERSVLVRLRAEVSDYRRRMGEATSATREVGEAAQRVGVQAETSMGRMVQSANTQRQSWEHTGRVLAGFGAITVTALGASAAAAIKWESDWTGVLKTVDGTNAELEVLEGGLREMARTLPATHTEIAGVAEAAGQLGVRTKDILGFTRVMIDLGETTNLTASEAATAIAQLMNVMRTAPGDVGRLGAALVARTSVPGGPDVASQARRSSAYLVGLDPGAPTIRRAVSPSCKATSMAGLSSARSAVSRGPSEMLARLAPVGLCPRARHRRANLGLGRLVTLRRYQGREGAPLELWRSR